MSITKIINELRGSDGNSTNQVFELVYSELKAMAQSRIAKESSGHILQATALVNEVFLKLSRAADLEFVDRKHFFRIVAKTMQRILIDGARKENRIKRGGGMVSVPLTDSIISTEFKSLDELIDLNDALSALEKADPDTADLVRLHVFAELTLKQTAEVLGVSESTVERRWRFSRAWLKRHMDGS